MSFNFSNPYPSTRLSLFARNAVSTSHPLGDNPKIQGYVAASDARRDGQAVGYPTGMLIRKV